MREVNLIGKRCKQQQSEISLGGITKPNHPWTNGQVERMNRTIEGATVKRFHYERHDQLRLHFADLIAYIFTRRIKPLIGLTPSD